MYNARQEMADFLAVVLEENEGGKKRKKKKDPSATTSGSDPKTTALTHLGIAIGSKNLKTLRREEVDTAFTGMFVASVHL